MPIGEANVSIIELLDKLDPNKLIKTVGDSIYFQVEDSMEYGFEEFNMLKSALPFSKTFPLTAVVIPAGNGLFTVASSNEYIDLKLDPNSTSTRIDSSKISSAIITIKIAVTNLPTLSPSNLKLTLNFPKMFTKFGGVTNQVSPPITTPTFGQSSDILISEFTMDNVSETGTPIGIKLEVKQGASPITISATSNIMVDISFKKIDFKALYGKFELNSKGSTLLTIPLQMLSTLPNGFHFADPKVELSVLSNIGFPLKFNIDYIRAYAKSNPSDYLSAVFIDGTNSKVETINKSPKPGQYIVNKLAQVNSTNGRTDLLFIKDPKPDNLDYKFSLQNVSDPTPSFIIPGMKLKANYKVQIPLQLKAGSQFELLNDTIQEAGKMITKLEKGSFFLNITNGIPGKITFSMKFLNSAGVPIVASINDSTYKIIPPKVKANGLIDKSELSKLQLIEVKLSESDIVKLKDAKNMVFTLLLDGKDENNANKLIYFDKSNFFKVKLGLFGKASTTL